MPEIKIMVSCRTDVVSEIPANPLYVPIRCGAALDGENLSGLPGDDTGENISEKKSNYSEFTVQYWVWKNLRADYVGLCHYRRFLSFSGGDYPKNDLGLAEEPILSRRSEEKYGLLDAVSMTGVIQGNDLVVMEPAAVERMHPPGGAVKTVREMWDAHDGMFFRKRALDMLLELVAEMRPAYLSAAEAYLGGALHYGYNCYVMKRELFEQLCDFQFPVLFELEKRLAADTPADHLPRTVGFMGEILYGIFVYHGLTQLNWQVRELPLVYFYRTEILRNPIRRLARWMNVCGRIWIKRASLWLLPLGSGRRNLVKKCYHWVVDDNISKSEERKIEWKKR